MTPRRRFAAILATALASAIATPALAAWPEKPVRLIVPYAPGGPTDLVARALAKQIETRTHQTFIVENRPGANGTLGALQMAKAAPDGYQLSLVPVGIFRQPFIEKMSLQPLDDLTYVCSLVDYSYFVVVNAASPWKSVQALVADARRHPGKLTYGTPGPFSTPHLSAHELGEAAGIDWRHIPYKSATETFAALLGRQIDVAVSAGTPTLAQHIDNGSLRLLAALSETRSSERPTWPTMKEQGYPVVAIAPFGLVGPAGMAPALAERIAGLFKEALDDPGFQALARQHAIVSRYMDPAAFSAYARQTYEHESRRMPALLKAVNRP